MGDGAHVEQTVADRIAVLVERDAIVVFADEMSAASMCYCIHGGHEHQSGIALVCAYLEFCVSITCACAPSGCINRLFIMKDKLHHRVGKSVSRR